MPVPRLDLLHQRDLRGALLFAGDVADALDEDDGFTRCTLAELPRLVASELTTLSLCDLASGQRRVIGAPALGAAERECFDRHFREHPLVRYHGVERGRYTHRISDALPPTRFRQSALFNDYYRRIGIDHVVALPLHADDGWLVSFVLNRRGRDFSDREVALLDALRRPLKALYARAISLRRAPALDASIVGSLTAREREVLRWVAAGKTDRDIAELLAISPRTVHKHLQRVYAKLGVETRTAAVMRALAPTSPPRG